MTGALRLRNMWIAVPLEGSRPHKCANDIFHKRRTAQPGIAMFLLACTYGIVIAMP
jgi:hypothetical protein